MLIEVDERDAAVLAWFVGRFESFILRERPDLRNDPRIAAMRSLAGKLFDDKGVADGRLHNKPRR